MVNHFFVVDFEGFFEELGVGTVDGLGEHLLETGGFGGGVGYCGFLGGGFG